MSNLYTKSPKQPAVLQFCERFAITNWQADTCFISQRFVEGTDFTASKNRNDCE